MKNKIKKKDKISKRAKEETRIPEKESSQEGEEYDHSIRGLSQEG
jgi:hypothetical protein